MKNSKTVFQDLVSKITLNESRDEIRSLVYLVLEHVFGITQTDILAGKSISVDERHQQTIDDIILRINNNEPVQYILGEAEFYGRKFKVAPGVLIPRPETEELINAVIDYIAVKGDHRSFTMLDVGTGSGCIPITLSLEIPGSSIYATDISLKALEIASANLQLLNANVEFIHHDILLEEIRLSPLNVVVSNPPYITLKEKSDMKKNVTEYEPGEALFVPDNDPLLFYKAIASKASKPLLPGGLLAVEINEHYGKEVAELFATYGYEKVQILKDVSGKDRIVTALKKTR